MSKGLSDWLTVWCGAVGLFGVVLMGGAFVPTEGPALAIYDLVDGAREPQFGPDMRFTLGILGAVTLGWSLTLLAAVRAAIQLGAAGGGTWRLVTLSVLGWYVIDSGLSIATGFALNAVSNTVLAAGFLIPVMRSGVLARG